MKYIIDKSFSFCYGHRVHNQRLDTNFTESGDACLACRHLHGHEGLIKVFLEEDGKGNVAETGMVTDFKHLGWFKNFLDDTLDHKMILDTKDPLNQEELGYLINHKGFNPDMIYKMPEGYYVPNLTALDEELKLSVESQKMSQTEAIAVYEKYEGIVLVDFVPTSENLTSWLLSVVQEKMKDMPGVRVKAVEYWETPKSHCKVEV